MFRNMNIVKTVRYKKLAIIKRNAYNRSSKKTYLITTRGEADAIV